MPEAWRRTPRRAGWRDGKKKPRDSSGNLYIAGSTNAPSFPVTVGAFQTSSGPFQGFVGQFAPSARFVSKFDPRGSLVFSTYFRDSGNSVSSIQAIAVDAAGRNPRSIDCPATGVMLRWLADENFNNILRALFRSGPGIDIVRAQDAGLTGIDDEALLAWAAQHGAADPPASALQYWVLVIRQDLVAWADSLIRIKTLHVLFSSPVCIHADGQPHGSAIGELDDVIGGGSALCVLAEESRLLATSKRDRDRLARAARAAIDEDSDLGCAHQFVGRTGDWGVWVFLAVLNLGGHAIAIFPRRVAVQREELPEAIAFAKQGAYTGEHRPHVAADVATQVHDPAGGMRLIQVRNNQLEIRFVRNELPIVFGKAFGYHYECESLAAKRSQAAFGFVSPGEWARRPRLLCGLQRRLRRRLSLCFEVLQRGGRMKGAVMVVETGESEPDRIVSIDRDFGTRGASERLFAEVRPVYVVTPKGTGLHGIERAIQVANRV